MKKFFEIYGNMEMLHIYESNLKCNNLRVLFENRKLPFLTKLGF